MKKHVKLAVAMSALLTMSVPAQSYGAGTQASLTSTAASAWKELTVSQKIDLYDPVVKLSDLGVDLKAIESITLWKDKQLETDIEIDAERIFLVNEMPLQPKTTYYLKVYLQDGKRIKAKLETQDLPSIQATGKEQVVVVPAMPEKGFHYPYILRIPTDRYKSQNAGKKRYLLVEPNNIGASNTSENAYLRTKDEMYRPYYNKLAEQAWMPKLMPAFPRYRFNIDNEYFLTHSLDRMSVLLTAARVKTYLADSRFQSQMKLSGLRGKDFEAMVRVDKQLEAMIDHAIGYLNGYEHNVDGKKVFLFGFSASGNFANRWALLYPDRVKGVIAGGTNSQPTIPAKEVDGEKLIFPIGVYDYKGITGKEFSKEAYGKVANFIFQGERDEADTYGMPDT
ncbi:hypothetical protein, partial [Paenibacillus sp.]|uniref:hypothetical protein n=1 Tax=Paenibacillus sp. TaxID=58172 RepID=UPI002D433ED0